MQYQEAVLVVEFLPDSQVLAIGGYFSELVTVDVSSCEIEQRVSIPFGDLWSIHFLNRDAMVVGLGTGRVAYLHRLGLEKHWQRIREATVSETNNQIRRIVPLPDGQNLLVTLQENRQLARIDPMGDPPDNVRPAAPGKWSCCFSSATARTCPKRWRGDDA